MWTFFLIGQPWWSIFSKLSRPLFGRFLWHISQTYTLTYNMSLGSAVLKLRFYIFDHGKHWRYLDKVSADILWKFIYWSNFSTLFKTLFFPWVFHFRIFLKFSFLWHVLCCGLVVISTAQLHSTKPELWFCADSVPAFVVLENCDCKNLWQWSQWEIRLNALCRSTIPENNSSSLSSSWYFFVIADFFPTFDWVPKNN